MSQMTLAFAQCSSAGRLMGQDLLQMINAGFNPLQEISKKTGKSMAVLKKEMEDGSISVGMVKQAFIDATSEGGRFYQMTDKQANTLNGKWSTMKDGIAAVARTIGNDLAPTAKSVLDVMIKLANEANRILVKAVKLKEFTQNRMNNMSYQVQFDRWGEAQKVLQDKSLKAGDPRIAQAIETQRIASAEMKRLKQERAFNDKQLSDLESSGSSTAGSINTNTGSSGGGKKGGSKKDKSADAYKSAKERIDAEKFEIEQTNKIRAELNAKGFQENEKYYSDFQNLALSEATAIRNIEVGEAKNKEQLKFQVKELYAKKWVELGRQIQSEQEQEDLKSTENLKRTMYEADQKLNDDLYNAKVKNADKERELEEKKAEDIKRVHERINEDLYRSMGDNIRGLMQHTMTFRSFMLSVIFDIARAQATASLTNFIGSNTGSTGKMGFAVKAAKIGTSLLGGKFADGGNPPMGKISLVGERGPELFVPSQPGTIIPNSQFSLSGGSTQTINNITLAPNFQNLNPYESQKLFEDWYQKTLKRLPTAIQNNTNGLRNTIKAT
jgi:tape measure domain-containing protein